MQKKTIIFSISLTLLILGELVTTIGTYYALLKRSDNDLQARMTLIGTNVVNELTNIVEICEYELARTTAVLRINGINISESTYDDMMQFNKSTGLDSIQYYMLIIKLTPEDLLSYEDFCSQNIVPNCTITEIVGRSLEPVSYRPHYWPLIFTTVITSNGSNFDISLTGFDLYSINATRSVIDSGLISESDPSPPEYISWSRISTIVQGNKNPYNYDVFLSKLSLIDQDGPYDVDNTIGMASMIVSVGKIITTSFKNSNADVNMTNNVDIFVFDVTENTPLNHSLLYHRLDPDYTNITTPDDIIPSFYILRYDYQFANKNWSIYFSFLPLFVVTYSDPEGIIVPIVMAIIFVLVDIIIIILYRIYILLVQQIQMNNEKNIIAKNILDYVNHEIRNPLNVIKGLVSYISDRLDPYIKNIQKLDIELLTTIISDLSTVNGACDMLEHIVTDILDIRKLESGKLNLDIRIVIIHDFIQDVKKTIIQKINEKQTIILKTDYTEDMTMKIDPYRLKQILLNYLTNAVKYTDEGTITILIRQESNTTRFSVIDTGRGIRAENKYKIFQPFNQISSEDATRYGGIGLGLYLCNMLASRMNGTVGFTSEFSKGSTFWVEFPNEVLTTDASENTDEEEEMI